MRSIHRKTWDLIMEFLLGRKYYANIIGVRGTGKIEIGPYVFRDAEKAAEHRQSVEETRSFLFLETITFRSRKDY